MIRDLPPQSLLSGLEFAELGLEGREEALEGGVTAQELGSCVDLGYVAGNLSREGL